MVGKCTVDQLEIFLREYNERFLWELEGQEREFAMQGAALPLELDELIMYISEFFSPSYPDIYIFDYNQDQVDEDTDYASSIEIIMNANDISEYVVYDGKHSDFLLIGFSQWSDEAYTLLALPIEDYTISEEDD